MAPPTKTASLASKKAFIANNRVANYRASLRLEGIQPPTKRAPVSSTGLGKLPLLVKKPWWLA